MESTQDRDRSSYKEFLEEFCKNHKGPVEARDTLPFRLTTCYLTEAEVEGECLDWTLQYLHLNKCPSDLALHLAHAVSTQVKRSDLTLYREEVTSNETPYHDDPEQRHLHSLTETRIPEEESLSSGSSDNKDATPADNTSYPLRLEADRLVRTVFTKVHDVCEAWRTELPVLTSSSIDCNLEVSVHAVKNKRRKMEDKHVVIGDLNALFGLKDQPPQSYYGVFDGHGGTDAAVYAAAHLHSNIVQHKAFSTDPATAMQEAFRQTDSDFVRKAERENLRSGTTGVCALVREKQIFLAWLGDSQALLVRDGRPVEIMNPHKPEREDEKQRIEDLGGCVIWFGAWRVNGSLSVSRAIGDADHKPYVSGEPDLNTIRREGTEDYLVLACDGLWDTVSSSELTAVISEHLNDNAGDRSQVAHKLVKAAADSGSNDNISVIVVFLRDVTEQLPGQAQDRESEKISNDEDGRGRLHKGKDGDSAKERGSEDQAGVETKEKKQQVNTERQAGGSGGASDGGDGSSEAGSSSARDDSLPASSQSSMNNLNLSNSSSTDDKLDSRRSDSEKPGASGGESDTSIVNKVTISPIQSGGEGDAENSPGNSGRYASRYENSPAHSSEYKSDQQSDTSVTDLALMSKTATRCINNRKAKRTKANRNGHLKDGRRANRGRIGSAGLLHFRTAGVPPRSRSAESNLAQAQRSMLRSGDQIFEMITGCSPNMMRKTTNYKTSGKWTVAVEMENASHMFDRKPADAISRRRSDTPIRYQKK